jgi:hypothetical protein
MAKTMQTNEQNLYGLLAKFDTPEELALAADRAYQAGYRKFDTYSPYPIQDLSLSMRLPSSPMPFIILAGALAGAAVAFLGQTFATVIDYPLNIGGRPLFSWPAYIPITFELAVLFGALAGVLGLFAFTRFPQPYHPVFRSDDFIEHASQDGFYLGIEANDPQFDLERTRRFLQETGSSTITELEA